MGANNSLPDDDFLPEGLLSDDSLSNDSLLFDDFLPVDDSLSDILLPDDSPTFPAPDESLSYRYSWKHNHFAEGGLRYAYAGVVNKGLEKGKKLVIKKWIDNHIFESDFWDLEIFCHKTAKNLIDTWNDLDLISKKYSLSLPKKIVCTTSPSDIFNNDHKRHILVNEWVLGEDYLEGTWDKWNSNSGYVNLTSTSIQAFCHWTYNYSGGKYLMCDAQGVRGTYDYKITDPCIISNEGCTYGSTDIGKAGIDAFFSTHKCNEFCNDNWLKPKVNYNSSFLPKKKTSTYVWQTKLKYKWEKKVSLLPIIEE